jgi:hypothetical protein
MRAVFPILVCADPNADLMESGRRRAGGVHHLGRTRAEE